MLMMWLKRYAIIKPTQLKGPKRDASLAMARQITMYILKKELSMTHVEIGNMLGGRDHTTVMHGVDKISKLVDNKDKVFEDISGITRTLRG
jgi:chromosomal replication initiator protein